MYICQFENCKLQYIYQMVVLQPLVVRPLSLLIAEVANMELIFDILFDISIN